MKMDRDFREFVESFLDHDVRFLIVGGYALAAHGAPRYTGDLDAWLWVDRGNAEKIIAALADLGFGSLGIAITDLIDPDLVIQLGYPPRRIDLLTGIDGVDFNDAWDRRIEIDVDGQKIPFISRTDLIANKTAAGRPQNLADVARLEPNPAPGD